jgi:hypothetical protein
MKHSFLSLSALAAAVLVSGCVAYPAGGYRDYGDGYRSGYSNDRRGRDCRDDRNCDRRERDGRHDRDGDRGEERGPRP